MSGTIPVGASVIFIDGECVFCNHVVTFILAHDRRGQFLFAHLQGALAAEVLARHQRQANALDSIHVLVDAGTAHERLLWDGEAAREIWPRLFWFAAVLRWVPLFILDFGYHAFAQRRYRLFGKFDSCHVPTLAERARFLDIGGANRGPAVAS